MKYRLVTYALAVFIMILLMPFTALAQQPVPKCGDYEKLINYLYRLGERRFVWGDISPETGTQGQIEIWSHPDGKEWTLVAVDPNKQTGCLIMIGHKLEVKPLGHEI